MQPVEAPAPAPAVAAMPSPPTPSAKTSPGPKGREPRTIKLRNVIAVAVASLLLLGSGWAWSLNRDGVSTATRDRGVTNGVDASGTVVPNYKTPSDATIRGGLPESPPVPPQTPPATTPRDIVTTGSLQMVVAEPTQVADRLISAVTDAGGRVDSRSEQSGAPSQSGSPVVDLVLRIPSDKVDGVLADAKKLGVVESMSISHADVTSKRVDVDARIEALQTSVNRLLELMGRAGNTSDLLAAESSLTERQAELDSLRAQRTALHDEITYSTINVNLSVKPTVARVGFLGSVERGWQSLISAIHGVVVAVGFLLPWIPVLAVLALVAYIVARVVRAKWFPRASRADQSSA
jgi:Ca-activated chloride channel homolog